MSTARMRPDEWPTCWVCGKKATCIGRYMGSATDEPSCDECCGHGNEDGYCEPIHPPCVQCDGTGHDLHDEGSLCRVCGGTGHEEDE